MGFDLLRTNETNKITNQRTQRRFLEIFWFARFSISLSNAPRGNTTTSFDIIYNQYIALADCLNCLLFLVAEAEALYAWFVSEPVCAFPAGLRGRKKIIFVQRDIKKNEKGSRRRRRRKKKQNNQKRCRSTNPSPPSTPRTRPPPS